MRRTPLHLKIDCHTLTTIHVIHESIASQLNFPAYYGHNLDALKDCLQDVVIEHTIHLAWKDTQVSKHDEKIQSIRKMIEDISSRNAH